MAGTAAGDERPAPIQPQIGGTAFQCVVAGARRPKARIVEMIGVAARIQHKRPELAIVEDKRLFPVHFAGDALVVWERPLGKGPYGPQTIGAMGLLSTAGGLVFGNDGVGDFVGYRDTDGEPLWHSDLGVNTSNGATTYMLDGKQYVLVGAGDAMYAFALQ